MKDFPPSELLFRNLLENLTDLIYFKDRDSRFILNNPAHAKALGAEKVEDMIGKTDADYFGVRHAMKARDDEVRVMEEGVALNNILEQEDFPDGRVAWKLTSKAPIRDERGSIVGVLGISKDITELKRIQEELLQAEKKISEASRNAGRAEIASIVIHNVGNMLNSVNVTASMIDKLAHEYQELKLNELELAIRNQLDKGVEGHGEFLEGLARYMRLASERFMEGSEEIEKEIELLKKDIGSIQRIIQVQQDIATHMRAGQFRSCSNVVEDALEINRIAFDRHVIRYYVAMECDPGIEVPEFQVLQVMLNFLSNAKYALDSIAPDQRKIIVRARVEGSSLLISVEDNGVGMNAEQMDRIFEMGFSTREGGHGIGLHGCKLAAKEINAEIEAMSKGKGAGSSFILRIPLDQCRTVV